MVTPRPKAMLSPALPVVCVMLFSRMVARRTRNTLVKARKMVMESTATGMLALTVRPTLSTRYMLEAPKRMPSSAPTMSGTGVSSGMSWSAGTKGLWTSSAASMLSTVALRALAGWDIRWLSAKVRRGNTEGDFRRTICAVFSVKLVARPDARMVEVPLEIEAELPREFEGAALLAASGLPRKVKIKAPRDSVKLSTAYRTDQLLCDIVKTALRGTEV